MSTPFQCPTALALHVLERFQIELSDVRAEQIFKRLPQDNGWWSICTWNMWLKNRISEDPGWGSFTGQAADIRLTCELHVFFTQIIETPEHLARLRNEKLGPDGKPVRSRLSDYLAEIKPVNQTAAKVVQHA